MFLPVSGCFRGSIRSVISAHAHSSARGSTYSTARTVTFILAERLNINHVAVNISIHCFTSGMISWLLDKLGSSNVTYLARKLRWGLSSCLWLINDVWATFCELKCCYFSLVGQCNSISFNISVWEFLRRVGW